MLEKIIRIENKTFTAQLEGSYKSNYDGFEIVTDKQTIQVGISSEQCCCESFGCLITNDDIKDFIGSKIRAISLTDTALNNKKIEELEYLDAGNAMFINIETSNGLLQFVAYNAHNGYYGHEAVLLSKQLNHSVYC
jgi:hypothetical protein